MITDEGRTWITMQFVESQAAEIDPVTGEYRLIDEGDDGESKDLSQYTDKE